MCNCSGGSMSPLVGRAYSRAASIDSPEDTLARLASTLAPPEQLQGRSIDEATLSITFSPHMRRLCFFIGMISLLCSGCGTVRFYGQAARGQWQIVSQARPIPKVLGDPKEPAELKRKLQLILQLREFARHQLELPVDDHYARYADLHRRFVVWNVHAAPRFSLLPRKWWFPLIGRVSYRGYFSEEQARAYADELKRKGDDVTVDGVEAYSTLGWLRDPVLNTFLHRRDDEIAELLFHELSHQVLYVHGDTDFSEAFASASAELGLTQWLNETGQAATLETYRRELERKSDFGELILAVRGRLRDIYSLSMLTPAAKEAQKQAQIAWLRAEHEKLKQRWNGYSGYDRWFKEEINNAKLNTVATYYELVPGFKKLWQENGGDFGRFYAAVRTLAKLPPEARRRRLLRR